MNINELEKLNNEGVEHLPSLERRTFLRAGLAITGLFMGGTILSLTSARNAQSAMGPLPTKEQYPYSPHYSMVMRQNLCIDCERCMEACVKTNHVPEYGYRTIILERTRDIAPKEKETIFMPVLCNQCNEPPCVRVCPTVATYKDKTTGIVMMDSKKCIGCKTCMAACPYNARYFNEEIRAVDKCNFCFDTRLSKGMKDTACVEACPAHVRVFGDLSDPESEVYQLIHKPETTVWVLRPETGALPNVFYMNA
ncbi:4Fe-4S dicluster domain-containing protein [Desulfobulbus rhabdoformis]|uniref:4Fe-4S dicluster domain-containing protein n=1 Tax=Desulfobulbus rhabdoformis TaxID=34032 RepID=UPI0019642AD6|nr:4Fe-4S dicluster domain-containing protein [Desulfobulbus rhabdoformis]MBM9613530.1 4Fe-4S dicluster domain-containing protein [Desulfobulbus rhabdoformis]